MIYATPQNPATDPRLELIPYQGHSWRSSTWIQHQIRRRASVLLTPKVIRDMTQGDAHMTRVMEGWEGWRSINTGHVLHLLYDANKKATYSGDLQAAFAANHYKVLWLFDETAVRWIFTEIDREETLFLLQQEADPKPAPKPAPASALNPLLEPVTWRGIEYRTSYALHAWHLQQVSGKGWKRHKDFLQHIRTLPLYHKLILEDEIVWLPWYRDHPADMRALQPLFRKAGYHVLVLFTTKAYEAFQGLWGPVPGPVPDAARLARKPLQPLKIFLEARTIGYVLGIPDIDMRLYALGWQRYSDPLDATKGWTPTQHGNWFVQPPESRAHPVWKWDLDEVRNALVKTT